MSSEWGSGKFYLEPLVLLSEDQVGKPYKCIHITNAENKANLLFWLSPTFIPLTTEYNSVNIPFGPSTCLSKVYSSTVVYLGG